jgi:uncharacterized protein YceK
MKKFYLLLVIFFSLLGCSNNSVKDIAIDIQTRTDAKTPLNEVEEAGTQCTKTAKILTALDYSFLRQCQNV